MKHWLDFYTEKCQVQYYKNVCLPQYKIQWKKLIAFCRSLVMLTPGWAYTKPYLQWTQTITEPSDDCFVFIEADIYIKM